ncbi:class I SAM-dependent methyltransferase [Paracoccus pacificus]|uniref:Class I SAM-dependent methyltransferase n=1 Tax=Paracoccus pacificus TaxID=1463598 RepID=A0ABW4RA54_9RHOB
MTPLERRLLARIGASGPLSVADYMQDCLLDPDYGYYATRDPFGAAGDFTTAPEISQMFGELIGLALAQAWLDQGSPTGAVLAELGPGRGTLIADIRRATARVFDPAVHLVEASPHLRQVQRSRLAGAPVHWHDSAAELPQAPLFLVANEFFDALPIRQFLRQPGGWSERLIGAERGADGAVKLGWGLSPPVARIAALNHLSDTPPGTVAEICPSAPPIIDQIAQRIARHGGAAIIVDYGGWAGTGDTFQALRGHGSEDVLAHPGAADLTAHVDFAALAAAGIAAGVAVSAPVEQGAFLAGLGIGARAERLHRAGDAGAGAALRRLTAPDEMGKLFKAIALWYPAAPPPPGFTALPGARDADPA